MWDILTDRLTRSLYGVGGVRVGIGGGEGGEIVEGKEPPPLPFPSLLCDKRHADER